MAPHAREGDGITPETAVAALRLAEATEAIATRTNPYTETHFRKAAAQLVAGLDEFGAAMRELQNLGAPR